MKSLLAVSAIAVVGAGLFIGVATFAGQSQGESKPLTLPDFSTVEPAKSKIKFTSDCGSHENQNVLPGQSGFERCMPQDARLKEGVTR